MRYHRRDDAEFRRLVDEAKASWNLSDIVGRRTKLTRVKNEMKGLCVFHKERSPSMRVSDAKGTYWCFGCGAKGDIVRYVMETEGLGFVEALRWLGAADLPMVDPAERIRAAEEHEAERAAAIAEARAIWEAARPAAGSPAEVYLRSRGIVRSLPPSIRFAETYAWVDKETGEFGPDLPALVGAVTDGADQVIAIQRIFLRDGGRAKARMKKPKLSLGRIKGGALKLDRHIARDVPEYALRSPDSTYAEIIITEGPEDGLSLAQELPDARVWVALGTAMMPFVEYPPEVRSIVIAGQNDAPGKVAVAAAAEALVLRGYVVRTMFPDQAFKDWNDQLRGIRI